MFKYSAFQYICQCVVKDVLESNGLYNDDINKFVYQLLEQVIKNVNKVVPVIANAVTNASSYINRLIGGNKLNENEIKVLKQILRIMNN